MITVDSYEMLSALLSKQLRRGVRTNAFTDPATYRREIQTGSLLIEETPNALFLLHDRGNYQRMNFYLHDTAAPSLQLKKPTVLEIAARSHDTALQETISLWKQFGFREMFCRHRMMRPAQTPLIPSPCTMTTEQAAPADAPAVRTLMEAAFDPVAGCLPTASELDLILQNGELLKIQQDVAGLLHFGISRTSTEIRHLAVREDCRKTGAAQKLLNAYLERTDNAKSLVWVRTGNTPAEKFYSKNNYAPDGWTSTVLYYE